MFERTIFLHDQKTSYQVDYPIPQPAEQELIGRKAIHNFQWRGHFATEGHFYYYPGIIDFRKAAEPATCSRLPDKTCFSSGPLNGAYILIKPVNSATASVPRQLNSFASAALIGLDDYYSSFGSLAFFKSKFSIVFKRGLVEPDRSLRPEFNHWHNHATEENDILYSCTDELTTEFRSYSRQQTWRAPRYTVIRFDRHAVHNSPTNTSNETVKKTWWALTASLNPRLRNEPYIDDVLKGLGPIQDYPDLTNQLHDWHGNQIGYWPREKDRQISKQNLAHMQEAVAAHAERKALRTAEIERRTAANQNLRIKFSTDKRAHRTAG